VIVVEEALADLAVEAVVVVAQAVAGKKIRKQKRIQKIVVKK
jgi:hypothetical protein